MTPLKRRRLFVFFTLALLAIILAIVIFWIWKNGKEKCPDLIIYGNVDVRQVNLGFRVFGRVEKLIYEEGDYLKKGELMALLDQRPYLAALKLAQANVKEAQANYENAKLEFQRRDQLLDPAAISKEERDRSFYQEAALLSTLEAARANYETARLNYDDTQIFCPTQGFILTRVREPGSIANVGDPVYALSVESPVWIRTYVPEPDLGTIYFGMKAEVTTDTPGNPIYEGHIGFISPVAEFTPKTVESTELRTELVYRLRVIVDNPGYYLRQGMPVTIRLKRDCECREKSARETIESETLDSEKSQGEASKQEPVPYGRKDQVYLTPPENSNEMARSE